MWDVKEPTPLFEKNGGRKAPAVWLTFPGLGGLSVRRDLNVGITSGSSFSVIMATCKQCMHVTKSPFFYSNTVYEYHRFTSTSKRE